MRLRAHWRDVWQPIWERIMDIVPKTLKVIGSTWEAHGLNERLRFYRYNKGMHRAFTSLC